MTLKVSFKRTVIKQYGRYASGLSAADRLAAASIKASLPLSRNVEAITIFSFWLGKIEKAA